MRVWKGCKMRLLLQRFFYLFDVFLHQVVDELLGFARLLGKGTIGLGEV